MHAVVEAKSILKEVPRHPDEPKRDWIQRAGALFKLTRSQAKKIWYGEVKDISATRLDRMRDIREQLQESAARRRETLNDIAIGIATLRNDGRGGGAPVHDRAREGSGGERSAGAGESGLCPARQATPPFRSA